MKKIIASLAIATNEVMISAQNNDDTTINVSFKAKTEEYMTLEEVSSYVDTNGYSHLTVRESNRTDSTLLFHSYETPAGVMVIFKQGDGMVVQSIICKPFNPQKDFEDLGDIKSLNLFPKNGEYQRIMVYLYGGNPSSINLVECDGSEESGCGKVKMDTFTFESPNGVGL